ncbi:MAG: sigma-70 family RNA polymerase sigma factor [Verrucomicrobiota bacterium]
MSLPDSPTPNPHTLRVQSLFVQHQPQLRGFIQSLAPDFATADDVLQECFLTISAKAHEFELNSNFIAWARSIARFKILALFRDQNRRPPMLSEDVLESLMLSAPAPELDTPEAQNNAIESLRLCLGKLAPAAREIIHLRYFSQWGPSEISKIRECSMNAINVTLARSREVLRRCVEGANVESANNPVSI